MEIVVMRIGESFVGIDEFQSEDLQKFPHGKHLVIDVKEERNPDNHRRFFAFMRTAFDMQSVYDNPEKFRKYVQMKAGHYEEIVTPEGKVLYVPLSIKWSELKEDKFRELFKSCITAFLAFYNKYVGQMSDGQFYKIIDFD